jgi:hypothetical protein
MKGKHEKSNLVQLLQKKVSKYKTSHFPKVYIAPDIADQIETVKAYYKMLQTPPERPPKVGRVKSPIKIKTPNRVDFNFRSNSCAKIFYLDNPQRKSLEIPRNFSTSKSNSSFLDASTRKKIKSMDTYGLSTFVRIASSNFNKRKKEEPFVVNSIRY